MRGRRELKALRVALASAAALLGLASSAAGGLRDDTPWLQAKVDAGGAIFLPRLPDGQCYATRGLWVSRDDTTITSDGACIVALGAGEGRIPKGDGTFVKANAVFFVNHSEVRKPLPVRIAISGLHITVPAATHMHGVSVIGHEVTLSGLTVDGSPLTDVLIGSGSKGSGGMIGRIAVTDSSLSGGVRDVVSVFGPVGLRVEANVLSGARGKTAAGLHIRAANRGQPTLDVHVTGNRIAANGGPGVFLDLAPPDGLPVLASGIEVARNQILRNARLAPKGRRGGIVLVGGQGDGRGEIVLRDNVFGGNRGPSVLRRQRATARTAGPRSSPPPSNDAIRDDTAWLQARLDRAGGTIFLPRLPNGQCYATRGLWVSHDGTTITSDGACIVSLGLGPVRLHSVDGDPIAASAVLFVNRSTASKPAPVGVTISGLQIVVPAGQSMFGVAIFGHQITLSHVEITGSPKDDVTISGRGNGNSYAGEVSILDSTFSGATRNAISATAVIGLRIERNTIVGVRDLPPGQPAAGIDVEPDDRGQPALDVRIVGNTIQDNAGPGIMLELEPNDGAAVVATLLEISGNTILRNSARRTPPKRGGIVLAGGQDGGQGTLILRDNVIRGNGGPGILESRFRLVVDSARNDVSGNETP